MYNKLLGNCWMKNKFLKKTTNGIDSKSTYQGPYQIYELFINSFVCLLYGLRSGLTQQTILFRLQLLSLYFHIFNASYDLHYYLLVGYFLVKNCNKQDDSGNENKDF